MPSSAPLLQEHPDLLQRHSGLFHLPYTGEAKNRVRRNAEKGDDWTANSREDGDRPGDDARDSFRVGQRKTLRHELTKNEGKIRQQNDHDPE
jgi:hypothetical protein